MKPITQTREGEPEGNCFAACVASILECDLSDIPDLNDLPKGRNWLQWFNEELARSGFGILYVKHSTMSPFNDFNGHIPEGGHFIAIGPGPRGLLHSVVMQSLPGAVDGQAVVRQTSVLAHDPNPSQEGILEVTSFCFLLKR